MLLGGAIFLMRLIDKHLLLKDRVVTTAGILFFCLSVIYRIELFSHTNSYPSPTSAGRTVTGFLSPTLSMFPFTAWKLFSLRSLELITVILSIEMA